jgi:hypothetical protein
MAHYGRLGWQGARGEWPVSGMVCLRLMQTGFRPAGFGGEMHVFRPGGEVPVRIFHPRPDQGGACCCICTGGTCGRQRPVYDHMPNCPATGHWWLPSRSTCPGISYPAGRAALLSPHPGLPADGAAHHPWRLLGQCRQRQPCHALPTGAPDNSLAALSGP